MNIENILTKASSLRIAVVGDRIRDEYIIGTVDRISPEAPVSVLRVTNTKYNEGGAGNVVENLKGLGCHVSAFYGKNVPVKTRVMAGDHHLLRIDDEEDPYWMKWDEVDIGLGYGIENRKFDCVVISDYNKGMCSEEVVSEIIGRCVNNDIPVVVDTKKNLAYYREASVVKCNQKEWEHFSEENEIKPFYFTIRHDVDDLVITRGRWGIEGYNHSYHHVDGIKVDISDTCGAGDTCTAVLAVMKSLSYGLRESITLANIAAAEVCRHPGVYAIQKEDLLKYGNIGK